MEEDSLQSIEEAIRLKVTIDSEGKDEWEDVPLLLAESRWPIKSGISCPECGEATVVCCYVYVGSNPLFYYDQYCHVCRNPECHYGIHIEDRQMVGVEASPRCPWCDRNPCESISSSH